MQLLVYSVMGDKLDNYLWDGLHSPPLSRCGHTAAMILYIFCLLVGSTHCQNVSAMYTLVGDCPDVKLQENLDGTRVSIFET